MPASLFLRAKKEWMCRTCGEVILRGERYYRRRLSPVCLGCHTSASGDGLGPQPMRGVGVPSYMTSSHRNPDTISKKMSSPYPASFLYRGDVIAGERKGSEAITEAGEEGREDNLSPVTLVRIGNSRYVASRDTLLYLEGERHYFRTLTAMEWKKRKSDVG